ncbi:MAG TPA: hypothetical protein PLM98_15685, partial [Thiolinea sp.]|nr:hypothetical protein [Thiolinea sp.]
MSLVSYLILSFAEVPPSPLLLFAGNSQALGKQLWQTDQTAANTKVFSYLTNIPSADSNFYPLGSVGSYGIFAAFTPETGQEVWRTDGSSAGTQLL